jgi:hypothetical protein
MEKLNIAAVPFRLVRQRAKKSPHKVAVALIALDTWGIRATSMTADATTWGSGREPWAYACSSNSTFRHESLDGSRKPGDSLPAAISCDPPIGVN